MEKKEFGKMILMDFTGVYENQTFYNGHGFLRLDFKEVQGTNCYCDEKAEKQLGEQIRRLGPKGLHFLDSGNYHYVSKLWLDLVEHDFELLVFDHHTDMQEPALGNILSCGSWVKAALEQNPRLKRVWPAGPSKEGAREAEGLGYGSRVVCMSEKEMEDEGKWQGQLGKSDLPLYISVDKDVLSLEYAKTNWDQGTVTLQTVLRCIREAAGIRPVIGMDVCGEDTEEGLSVNDRTNGAFLAVFLNIAAQGK